MTQTTDAISWRNCKIEYSTDGNSFTDIGGWTNNVEVKGGDREIGEFFTVDGDTPVITAGKRKSIELMAKVLYTEPGSPPWETVNTAYENASALYLRWSPLGGATGQKKYTSGKGIVMSPVYPSGEASKGDPIVFELKIKVPSVAKALVP